MIKKIPIAKLKVGMYVINLNADWIPHGPKNKEGKITQEKVVQDITKLGIKDLYIDTNRGLDCNEGQPEVEVEESRQKMMEKVAELPLAPMPKTSLFSEAKVASKVHKEAKVLVSQALLDAKFGKAVDLVAVDALASSLVGSVLRNKDALMCLSSLRDKDAYLMEHSVNLSVLMTSFGSHLGLPEKVMREAAMGALLHDLGKVMIPNEVLQKPGKLTPEEFEIMKSHVFYSRKILEETPGVPELAIIVASQHHEKMDGSGYPQGLKGDQISKHGRMVGIVDVYDAVTADRCYHKGMTAHQALKKLLEWSGNHLDPELVVQFIRCVGIYPVGSLVELKSGKVGVVLSQNDKLQKAPLIRVMYNLKNKCYVMMEDIDLAKPNVQDEIVRSVDAVKLGIDTKDFLVF